MTNWRQILSSSKETLSWKIVNEELSFEQFVKALAPNQIWETPAQEHSDDRYLITSKHFFSFQFTQGFKSIRLDNADWLPSIDSQGIRTSVEVAASDGPFKLVRGNKKLSWQIQPEGDVVAALYFMATYDDMDSNYRSDSKYFADTMANNVEPYIPKDDEGHPVGSVIAKGTYDQADVINAIIYVKIPRAYVDEFTAECWDEVMEIIDSIEEANNIMHAYQWDTFDIVNITSSSSKETLSWKILFEPDPDLAKLMYALSGLNYGSIVNTLGMLADVSVRETAGALSVAGYEEESSIFNDLVDASKDIIKGTMSYNNTNYVSSADVMEYFIANQDDFQDPNLLNIKERWERLARILREVSDRTVNKTSAVGKHVAWRFQSIPEVSPSTGATIEVFLKGMAIEPEILIAPFLIRFTRHKALLMNLKAALQNDDLVDLYNDVVWLQNKIDDIVDRTLAEMTLRGVDSLEPSDVITESESNEFEQKYTALYNTFKQIVGENYG